MPSAKSNVKASLTVGGHRSLLCTPALAGWGLCVSHGTALPPGPRLHGFSCLEQKEGLHIEIPCL